MSETARCLGTEIVVFCLKTWKELLERGWQCRLCVDRALWMISALTAVVPAQRAVSVRPAAQRGGLTHPCEPLAEACDVCSRSRRTLGVAGSAWNPVEETLGPSRGRGVTWPQRNRGQLASDGLGVDETGVKHCGKESGVLGAAREHLCDAQILGMKA